MSSMDARIPVLFGRPAADLAADTAVLAEGHDDAFPGAAVVVRFASRPFAHQFGAFAACSCCAPRGQVAQALGRLFFARARGDVAFFRQVVVIGSDEAAIRAELAADVLTSARYRIAP